MAKKAKKAFRKALLKSNSIITLNTLIVLISLSISSLSQSTETCPDYSCPKVLCDLKLKGVQNFCENVQCAGINVANCTAPENSTGRVMYEEHVSMCGCCAGCVKYLGLGETCNQYPPDPTLNPDCTEQFCPILMHRCAPGLECPLVGPTEKKCSLKDATIIGNGNNEELNNCHNKRAMAYTGDLYWTPQCEPDETYSPKQCKGPYSNGICFCVSKEGKRIFGTQYQNKAQNQTCACSRQVYELRESGYIASFHCSQEGNYEPIQCDTESGLCYCVEPKTGKLTGAVLPESQWKSLPCYSVNYTNFNPDLGYYRICESEWAIAKKLELEASLHGLKVLSGRRLSCDLDGSFAPVENMSKQTRCLKKNGDLIGAYFDQEGLRDTDCNCVRDEIKYVEDGIPFLKKCDGKTGNYDWISPVDHTEPVKWQCVDRDGIFFGNLAEDPYKCCLFGNFQDPRNCTSESVEVQTRCYDPNADEFYNQDKIRPCYFYPQ